MKFAVIDSNTGIRCFQGQAERLGQPEAHLSWKGEDQSGNDVALAGGGMQQALGALLDVLKARPQWQPQGVGHRVVHGAEEFTGSVQINDEVVAALEACTPLAPLHNPANLAGIEAARIAFPDLSQVAVFDTAFHQTLPEEAYRYAVPEQWYRDFGVRRYGFHGTSHRFVADETARRLGKPLSELHLITAHLGNGCSLAAIREGRSVDTTMGMTPLEGMVMGTRCGDLDPGVHAYIAEQTGMSLPQIMQVLNKESGLLGLSGGCSNDMRTLVEAESEGNSAAKLALDVFVHRLARLIGGMAASLERIDALVFTGGIGENNAVLRERVLSRLAVFGFDVDVTANACHGKEPAQDGVQGSITSLGMALVVPTDEERVIAQDTALVLKGNK